MALLLLSACIQSDSDQKLPTGMAGRTTRTLSLDTFSTFPPEIDGCACYFSNDSLEFGKGHYIYVNDYAQTCFVKLNGVVTRFNQIDFKELDSREIRARYKNEDYELTVESKTVSQNGDETWLHSGTIKITDKSGNTLTKTFYGECGC